MVYEVVTGQILLAMRARFEELHATVLLPAVREVGAMPVAALMVEVGQVGRFCDVYQYASYHDYDLQSATLEGLLTERGYYPKIQECIVGSIEVNLARSFLGGEQ
jgi:hypothetical protein